ncbi:hypothetical protein PF004_g1411 [Phytophthora fragariae]|uniref:DUF6818 domain-containing protein n=1 Tax=Phytophthora fragariae TaxID=53985 RepID=A0A6A3LMK1_9STRA|nr:hypothetical protein PF011_g5405 [Phytophthora fragariae]KAE9253662.1 hypothetical protein PF004_g1411 [Phytophthora fragariae]
MVSQHQKRKHHATVVRINKPQAWGRGKGWSTTELDTMISVVEKLLPMGSNQWDAAQLAYARRLSPDFPVREAEAFKRKFYKLKSLPKATGDADCPEEVWRAK